MTTVDDFNSFLKRASDPPIGLVADVRIRLRACIFCPIRETGRCWGTNKEMNALDLPFVLKYPNGLIQLCAKEFQVLWVPDDIGAESVSRQT